ncbi:hypothetical protein SARC_08264 [Sphaeroforma arctica JP610]|uniref:Fatty acid hydroxylase domain-containing protein n=1 Tax=Sphaeroforma arctica JP610 TaxID=667725 RepID=A0A0L0FR94_9EUKA|nr:hypothetical protein SARC_08264 [Sphaeroforma arctica JP610]KNC79342.1 hypothetical protein SARC_08264 [Sphaeroforma arctica JP610]|eukprot:XP_014153244.1 hypothetical protein SARC_08264 [Sphaeroforma arctica JP610]
MVSKLQQDESPAKTWRNAKPARPLLQLTQYIAANLQAYLLATLTYNVIYLMKGNDHTHDHRSEATILYLASLMRNIVGTATVYLWAKTKKSYNPPEKAELAWIEVFHILLKMLIVNSVVDTLEEYVVTHYVGFASVQSTTNKTGYDAAVLSVPAFAAKLFAWEILFDLGFYMAHRTVHAYPWLYRLAHKEHHSHRYVTVLTTHLQNPIDGTLNNLIPCVLACFLVPRFSPFEFQLVMAYKVLGELAGHTGAVTEQSSFPILVQVPRLLGIELRTIDHNHHHTHNIGNFGKRFSLWDKLLGTFVTPTNLAWPHIPTVLYTPSPPFFMQWFGKAPTEKKSRNSSKEGSHSFATSLTSRQCIDKKLLELESKTGIKTDAEKIYRSYGRRPSLRFQRTSRVIDAESEMSESESDFDES